MKNLMKRSLSLLLVLATLLCMVPVMTASAAAETASETEGLGDYRDLYVKDGLVALFTAYESVASATAPTTWAPANYYGIKGYEDYINPENYSHTLTGTWKALDGAYGSTGSSSAYNLAELGALIGTTWSVQTVWNLTSTNSTAASKLAQITQETVDNGDGTFTTKNVVSNYTSLTNWGKAAGFEGGANAYGPLSVVQYLVPSYYSSNDKLLGGAWFLQLGGRNAAGTGNSSTNIFFSNANYGMTHGTFYFTKADGTESSVDAWTTTFPSPVIEQTLARLGDGVVGTATTAFSWRFTYQFAPTKKGGSPLSSRTFTHTSYAAADSTNLKLLVGKIANNYAIRVYNKDLSIAEIDRNHFVDLCGFYGTDVSELLSFSDEQLAYVAGGFVSTKMYSGARNSEGYTAAKTDFETKLAAAVKIAKAAFKTPDTYELLYVKDGLVALFDAHSSVEELGTVSSWTPVNFYGKEGYDSYLEPTAYALANRWTAKNGSYHSASGAYFTLTPLINAMAEAADELYPAYTVQEVFNFTASPNGTNANYTVDADGDTVIDNYSALGNQNQYSTYGAFRVGYLFYGKCSTPSGVTFIHNYLMQLQTYNGSGFAYYRNFNTNTDYYATKGIYYYMADGVKTALNSGKTTYAGMYPSAVWEQTAWRVLDETSTDEENIVIDSKISWQFRPGSINSGSYSGRGFQFTTSDAVSASPNYNALTILNAGNINVYSVRVYNKTLSEAEMNHNHLADLCAFYEVDVTDLLTLSEEQYKLVATQMAEIALCKEKYVTDAGGNTVLSDAYKLAKIKFDAKLAEAIGSILTDGTTTYIDLYVKEGLVALFDAHSAVASDEAATEWTPVDLYGKEGYDAYLEPVAYPLYDNTGHLSWKWENGRLISYRQSAGGNANVASGLYFNLDSLGAQIGTTYTVQEVFQITDFNVPRVAPTVEIDESGHYIITNYASFSGKSNETSTTYYGPLQYNTLGYHKYSGSNDPLISAHFGQVVYYNASNAKKTSNTFFNTENYFTDPTRRTYYYMKDVTTTDETTGESVVTPTKTSLGKGSLGDLTWGVTEQSVARLGAGTASGSYTKLQYRFTWQFMPSKYGSDGATSNSKTYSTHIGGAISETSRLRVLGAKIQNAFSVRVYNVDLSTEAINQNHFADLCGFYGVVTSGIETLSESALNALITSMASVAMVKDAFDANGEYTLSYYTAKIALQNAINDAVIAENFSAEAARGNLLDFAGHSFRVSGSYGIRAIFTLSKENLVRLEEQGINLVSYGAIMAIGNYNGTVYNENADVLTLTANADGTVTLAENLRGAAVTSSVNDGFKTLSDDETAITFAYTTTYPVNSAAEIFSIDMLYRGFAVLEQDGVLSVAYYDLTETEATKNSLFSLHENVIENYGHDHTAKLGIDTFDYIYDVLSVVDAETYDAVARANAKNIASSYGFDENNIVFTFGALSDPHVVNAARGTRLANMMKVFSNTYNVDAILFAGDLADKLNGLSYDTKSFIQGYQELALFAEYAAAGNVNNLPLIWTMGNHERPHITNSEELTFTSGKNHVTYSIPANTTLSDGFRSVLANTSSAFATATVGAPTGFRLTEVNGIAFYAIDYTFANNETIAWLDAELTAREKAEPNKPIFITSHIPTTHSAQISCINECIEKHPNVVYLSGHTHVPMQSYSSITEREGFLELVLGPGSHANFGVSGSGYSYNSYEMKQGAVIEVDANGNVRVRCVDMNYNVEEDGSITTLFTKGGNDDLGTIAENPFVLRTAYFERPTASEQMHVTYDSVPRYMEDPRYEAPSFAADATVGVSDVTPDNLKLSIPKPMATNFIKYYNIVVTDAEGNKVTIYDPLDKKTVTTLSIGSEHTFYVPYDIGYPDPFVYTLKTSYNTTTTDESGASTTVTNYVFAAGESYTVHITAYDDFGTATQAITGTFTVPAE